MSQDWVRNLKDTPKPMRSKLYAHASLFPEDKAKPLTSQLLICSSCRVCVHAACYDVANLSGACIPWRCDKCCSLDTAIYKVFF